MTRANLIARHKLAAESAMANTMLAEGIKAGRLDDQQLNLLVRLGQVLKEEQADGGGEPAVATQA